MGLTTFCFVAAVVFFALDNNIAGGAFLAAPVLTAASRFFANVFSRSSRAPARPELPPSTPAQGEPSDEDRPKQ